MPAKKSAASLDRRAHPLAARLWSQLRDRSEADRLLVYEELRSRLGVAALPAKQEQAAEALRRFIDCQDAAREQHKGAESKSPRWALGPPSRRRYDDFRSAQADPREWPSSQFIRNAFKGEWNAALAAIGQRPAVDVLSRRLTARGKPYTREEVLAALRLWISGVDEHLGPDEPLRQSNYRRWAEEQRRSPDPPLPRFPTIPVIRQRVGRWPEVLVALGHPERSAQPFVVNPARGTGASVRIENEPAEAFDLISAPNEVPRKRWHHRPGTEETQERVGALISWLSWLATQLPENERRSLTGKEFDRYVASVRRVSLARGAPLHPPTSRGFQKCSEIGGWNRAKQLAGLLEADLPVQKRSTRRFSKHELLEAVVAAVNDHGPNISRAEYSHWRDERCGISTSHSDCNQDPTIRPACEPVRRIPSEALLRQRFAEGRSWGRTLAVALERAAELGLCVNDEAETSPASSSTKTVPGQSIREAA